MYQVPTYDDFGLTDFTGSGSSLNLDDMNFSDPFSTDFR